MHNRQESPQGPPPRSMTTEKTHPGEASGEADQQATEERLLAEVRHELGNFFHKLYYWAEFIREGAVKGVDSTASEMLERTITDFEGFLRVTLDYFSPVRLSLIKVPVTQLIDSLLVTAGCNRASPEVTIWEADEVEKATILVDPAYLSKAFGITVAGMQGQFGGSAEIGVSVKGAQRGGFPGFEVSISANHGNPSSVLLRPAAAGVQWAVARKLFEMHGGEMTEEREGRGQVGSVKIFLPVYR